MRRNTWTRTGTLIAILLLTSILPPTEAQGLPAYVLEPTPTTEALRGLGGNATEVRAVGDNGLVMARDITGTWTVESTPVTDRLRSATTSSLVTAVSGDNETLLELSGILGWQVAVVPGGVGDIERVRASDTEAFAFTSTGAILERTAPLVWATAQTALNSISDAEIAPNGTWYAITRGPGGCDLLTHQDGGAWNIHTHFDAPCGLFAVAADGNDIYLSGAGGRILYWDGAAWIEENAGTGTLRGLSILDDGTLIAVGGSGSSAIWERSPLGVISSRGAPFTSSVTDIHTSQQGTFIATLGGIVARREAAASLGGPVCDGAVFCDVRRYEIAHYQETDLDPGSGTVAFLEYLNEPWHSFVVANHTLVATISYSATFDTEANGDWYVAVYDGPTLVCDFSFHTVDEDSLFGAPGQDGFSYRFECPLFWSASVDRSITLSRSGISGPGSIGAESISIAVARQDAIDLESYDYRGSSIVLTELGNLTTFAEDIDMGLLEIAAFYEYAFWMLIFLSALIWGGYTKQYWVIVGGFVGVVSLFTPLGDWDTISIFILTLTGTVIGAFLRFFQRRREPTNDDENFTRFT